MEECEFIETCWTEYFIHNYKLFKFVVSILVFAIFCNLPNTF